MRFRMRTLFLVAFTALLAASMAGRIGFVYGAPPTSTTLTPINVTATSATLRGSVNPNGKSTGAQFFSDIWLPGVGMSPPENIGSGVVAVPVSYTATGLTPSTSYYYWVGAANSDGSSHGATLHFTTLPAAVSTDWAVTSVSLSPSAPHVGDPVTFSMVFVAFSSSGAFPQSVTVGFTIDGAVYATGAFTYPGPVGVPATITSQTPWAATPGTHTLAGGVATSPAGLDPNPSNNLMSTTFTVTSQPQAQFDFSISISSSSQTISPGGSTTYSVTVNLLSGTAQSVGLSLFGAPSGVSGSFNPASGTPPFSSTLSVTAVSSASPGTVTLTITGTGGGVTHTATATLTVSQAPDFRIDVTPPSQTVLQGQTASYAVSVAGLNGFNSQISLTVSGLPSGVGGTFSVLSSTPDYSSTLTVTIPSNSPIGSFALTVTGSGGGLTRGASVVLVVNPSQPQPQTTQAATTQTGTNTPGGVLDMLQQNSLLIIAALAVLVILFALLAMRGRGQRPVPQQMAPTRTFCGKCGAENPVSNEFCASCGNKLKFS